MTTQKIKSPDNGADHFSHGGQEYVAGEDGVFEVPAHVATEMLAHGFTLVVEAPPTNKAKAAAADNLNKANK